MHLCGVFGMKDSERANRGKQILTRGEGEFWSPAIHTRAPWHFQSPDSPMLARQFEALAFQNVQSHVARSGPSRCGVSLDL